MKMTIVTDSAGKVIAAVQGHSLSETVNGVQATVSFGAGHKLHQVDVDDSMGAVGDVAQYISQLNSYLTP
jgi:hypothetical protein